MKNGYDIHQVESWDDYKAYVKRVNPEIGEDITQIEEQVAAMKMGDQLLRKECLPGERVLCM